MKKNNTYILLLLILLVSIGCQKDNSNDTKPKSIQTNNSANQISVKEAQHWLAVQSNAYLKKHPIRWTNAKNIPTKNGNRITIHLPGQPTFQNVKQGYRQLSIQKNINTKQISATILEIIPDAIYFQEKLKIAQQDFTGRILEYDLNYRFQKGSIYANGKQVGKSRPATQTEKLSFQQTKSSPENMQHQQLGSFEAQGSGNTSSVRNKTARIQYIQTCTWYQTSFVDAEGIFTVYTERICYTDSYHDGGSGGFNDGGNNYDPNENQNQGGTGDNTTTAPEPANLPGEDASNVDPKKMTKCFAAIPNPGAAFQVKILVQEPLPGTTFNIGPNSFGHVAIQLTKQKGDQSITQILGFYPTGTGLSKLVSNATMKDNSDLEYDVSASYFTTAENFQKILNFVSSPPTGYHFTNYNCATFVYYAAQAGSLPTPNPTTQIGFAGPGGAGSAMTPAGMASALKAQKAASPNADITQSGGTAPASKGECNEE